MLHTYSHIRLSRLIVALDTKSNKQFDIAGGMAPVHQTASRHHRHCAPRGGWGGKEENWGKFPNTRSGGASLQTTNIPTSFRSRKKRDPRPPGLGTNALPLGPRGWRVHDEAKQFGYNPTSQVLNFLMRWLCRLCA